MRICEDAGCPKPAIVGLNGAWWCQEHYDAALLAIAARSRQAYDALASTVDMVVGAANEMRSVARAVVEENEACRQIAADLCTCELEDTNPNACRPCKAARAIAARVE